MLRDILMILFVTCSTLGSQLLIKHAVMKIAAYDPAPQGVTWLSAIAQSPAVWTAILIQGVGFVVWIVVVSRVKLGVAFAISGAFFYTLVALASWYLYGERLSTPQWAGIALVSVGVLMISMMGQKA